jgi:hypothetical protein
VIFLIHKNNIKIILNIKKIMNMLRPHVFSNWYFLEKSLSSLRVQR